MLPPALAELRDESYRRYQAGDVETAARLCRQLLAQEPRCAEAVYLLAVIANGGGVTDQVLTLFKQAAELAPDNAVFVNALGEACLTLGKQAEALQAFQEAIRLRPDYARAHNNLGRLRHGQGDLALAQASFSEAVRLHPGYAVAHNNLGAVFQARRQLDTAAAQFRRALSLQPDYAEAHFNLGTALQSLGDFAAAAGCFHEAIRLRPSYARAHFHLGQTLEHFRQDHDALACYDTAVRLDPNNAEMLRRRGDLLMLKKDWADALASFQRAADLQPGQPESLARLVYAQQLVCDWRSYAADVERLWAATEKQLAAGEASAVVPFQALTLPWSRSQLCAVARGHCQAVVRHQREQGQRLTIQQPRARTGRLRIGYLSGDFYDHPISHLLHGLFARHDRTRFEVFAYSFGPPDSSVYRRRIEADCEHFVDVATLSNIALAGRIGADGIHVLVDLMGHTGVNRLGTLALRPAPIQVSFLGMLGTMGADFIDYLIGDRIVTPHSFAPDFSEHFVTMPHSYLIAEPETPSPHGGGGLGWGGTINRKDHGLPETACVFCSFSSSYKIEPQTFAAWMQILAQAPGSVLWLYTPGSVFEDNLRREAAAQGVAPERLVFAPFLPRPAHFARHQAADLFLDTFRYNAAATASLALQAGLPVLTCPGDTFSARVGASLLHSVGLPELIAADPADYERRAVELAHQPQELRRLRDKLFAQRPSAPLFDTARFVRNLQHAYEEMWNIYASGQQPRPIEVIEPTLM